MMEPNATERPVPESIPQIRNETLAEAVANPSNILRNAEVKKYFLGLLGSNLSNEEKYDKIISYFDFVTEWKDRASSGILSTDFRDSGSVARAVSAVAHKAAPELWDPAKFLKETKNSVVRAVQRICNSQHLDGGWGYAVERSSVWGTVHGVLSLRSASRILEKQLEWIERIAKGIQWMKDHHHDWCFDSNNRARDISIYELAEATRCLCHVGVSDFFAVSDSVERLAESQNSDGGWDACIWGVGHALATHVYSEVGATSLAVRALAEYKREEFGHVLKSGLNWLLATQNADGSWNNGSCAPHRPAYYVDGKPTITKTCDALKGVWAAVKFGISDECQANRNLAVDWIFRHEKLLRSEDRSTPTGWVYFDSATPDRYSDGTVSLFRPDLESTCHTLEALVRLGDEYLPFITANARYLIDAQYRDESSKEDGKWSHGDTLRITRALLHYYERIRGSALFTPSVIRT